MARNPTSIVYGVLDLLVAGLYVYIFVALVPSRSALFTSIAMGLCALLAAGGVGLISGASWGRKVAAVASVAWLLACAVLIVLLVSSAAYLHGIYDGVGQAGAAIGLLMACLAFELVALLPALQLAHIRRAGPRLPSGARRSSPPSEAPDCSCGAPGMKQRHVTTEAPRSGS